MKTPEKITNTNHREATIRKHYPEFYQYLIDTYPNVSWMEKCYLYYNNLTESPKCPICGGSVKFLSFFRGYSTHCSQKCVALDPHSKAKRINTCIVKFGSTSPLGGDSSIRDKIERTSIEKYGGMGISSDIIRAKVERTNLERYGSITPMHSAEIQSKMRESILKRHGAFGNASDIIRAKVERTNLERYGVINFAQTEEYKQIHNQKFLQNHPEIISIDGLVCTCRCPHPGCGKCDGTYTVPKKIFTHRKETHTELCTNLLPITDNIQSNTSIELMVQQMLDELGVQYETSVSWLVPNKYIDIVIPSHKIAIECNGIYWHSDIIKEKNAHKKRMELIKSVGYQLITIWEDQLIRTPEIIKNILASKLGIYKKRIYARACQIKTISAEEYSQIMKYHLQGDCKNPIRYGLIYKGQIVAAMGFCKKRRSMMGHYAGAGEYELARFCTIPYMQIVGGAQRLLTHFIREYNPPKIISFSSNDISNGHLYKCLGFSKTGENLSYWYIDQQMNRYHRYNFRKSNLVKMGYDANLTEFEITDSMKLYRIWDAGQIKWELNL